MKRIIGVCLVMLAGASVVWTSEDNCTRYSPSPHGNAPQVSYYRCDTETELPASGVTGDTAYAIDTNALFVYAATAWVQINASGPGGAAAWGDITGTLSAQTDLQNALDGKEAANANIQAHVISAHAPAAAEQNVNADWSSGSGDSQVLNKPTLGTAAAKNIPAVGNASTTEVVYGTDTRLSDARTPFAHVQAETTITFTDVVTGNVSTGSHGYMSKLPGGTATFYRADGTWAAPGGGSDPWTYVKLAANTSTGSSTAVNVAGMSFTPTASTTYEVEGVFFMTSSPSAATVNPRLGIAWPTAPNDGVAQIIQTGAAAATLVHLSGNVGASLLTAAGGLLNNTQSWPFRIWVAFGASATVSGTFRIQMASETAGSDVTMKRGSYFRYRTY